MSASHGLRISAAVRAERGSAAAEFAVVLPAVLVILALCVGAIASTAQYTRLVDAAADAARSLGRGDADVVSAVARVDPGASVVTGTDDGLVCVDVGAVIHPLPTVGVPITVHSCALGEGG
ncbi:pilus assembly protein [Microbacteriaceae bacterium VKM Ac-2855]|nr:pilus assembly protein [Microbacteriaceae bacterium VKM Ac-2855]